MTATGRWTRHIAWAMGAALLLSLLFLAAQGLRLDSMLGAPTAQDPSVFVGDEADWLLDRGEIGVIDATTLPQIEERFTPSDGKMPGVGMRYYQGVKLWVRFTVPSLETDQTRWVIRLHNTRVRDAHLVVIKDGMLTQRDWAHDSEDYRAGLSTRTPAFVFERGEIEGATVLLGFNSLGAMRGNVFVETERGYHAYEERQAVLYSALLGIMWALAVYLVVIGTRLGEPSLVFAAGLSFTLGLFVYGVGGYVHHALLTGWPSLADVVLYGTQPWPPAFWMLLAIGYLDLGRRTPRLALVLTVIALLLPFQGVLTLLTALGYPVPFITDNATPVAVGMVCGLAPVIWFTTRGDKRARQLLLAFTPVALGSFVRLAMYYMPSPDPFLSAASEVFADMVLTVVLLAAVIVIDIQRREAALRQQAMTNEARFRAYADIATDSYFETDATGRISNAAGSMARRLGVMEGERLDDLLLRSHAGDTEAAVDRLRHASAHGTAVSGVEVQTRHADGRPAWLSFNLVPFARADGSNGLRGTISDVTEQVDRREREGRQNTLSALGQLASGVAHEVNNLLHPMVNLAQRVRDKHTSDPEARKLLDLVVASGKHAGEIVASVLNSFNPVRVPGERVPAHVALQQALDIVRPTVPATVKVDSRIAEDTRADVSSGEMLQVISNLLSNAIRAMDGTGRIDLSLEQRDDETVLRFSDNGPGMPENIRQRASEPFVTGRAEGTGLGLAVVANIVRGWQGEMAIESAPSEGTTIEIRMAGAGDSIT